MAEPQEVEFAFEPQHEGGYHAYAPRSPRPAHRRRHPRRSARERPRSPAATRRRRRHHMPTRRYLILIEDSNHGGFSAYAPDLLGCVATGATRVEVEREMHDAIEFHLEGLRDADEPIPEPSKLSSSHVEVAA